MAHELIRLAKSQGVHLYLENGALKYKAKNGLSKELAGLLKKNKPEVMAFLEMHTTSSDSRPKPRPDKTRFPLTSAQQRLFYLESLYGEKAPYNMATAFRLSKAPDIQKLEQAIQTIVSRHSALSTCFLMEEGEPYQTAKIDLPFTIEIDQSNERQSDSSWMAQQASRPFSLVQSPLFRVVTKPCTEGNSHILLFVFHHMVFDGLSYSLFFNELNLALKQQSEKLPSLDYQYGDYALWQQEGTGEQHQHSEHYWLQKMKGAEELNSLVTDYPRPATPEFSGSICRQRLDKSLTATLRAFAQQQGVSVFTLLHSLFALLIGRWTERSDVIIGTPVGGRQVSGTESLIGFFVNTLALRIGLDEDDHFLSLLQKSKTTLSEAFRYQDVPFERIVQALGHERKSSYAPILQILFALHEDGGFALDLDGIEVENLSVERSNINFELELHVMDKGEELEATWVYADNLFRAETIDALQDAFLTLIQGVLANPSENVHQLPMISLEVEQKIEGWNETSRDFPNHHTFVDMFEQQVKKTPDNIACEWLGETGTEQLTYAQLNKKANQLAHFLIAQGASSDQCIGLIDAWSSSALVGVLGILKSGAAYLPLDPNHPVQRLNEILELADVSITLAGSQSPEGCSASEVFDLACDETWKALDSYSARNPSEVSVLTDADDLAYVIFTSGSTGQPKGVMVEHKNVSNFLFSTQSVVCIEEDDVVASIAPPAFDIHVTEMYLPLMFGAKVVLMNWEQTRSPALMAECQRTHKISVMQGTPSTWQMLIDDGWMPYQGLKMLTGGDALGRQLHDKLLDSDARFYNLYGPTETTVYCSGTETHLDVEKIHVGAAFPNNRYYVLDDHRQQKPIGCVGEVYLSGDNVTRGYLNQPSLTDEKYAHNPFVSHQERMYQTGDLGRWLPDGTIEIVGRKDFQVKVNGFRIELGEIEYQLRQHQDVEQSLVTTVSVNALKGDDQQGKGSQFDQGSQVLVAYVKSQTSQSELVPRLTKTLTQSLPQYMVPHYFVVLPVFPLTDNRKVDRRALPLPAISEDAEGKAPSTETEKRLAALWSELLETEVSNIGLSFFALGGHSLLAIKMVSRIQTLFGVSFSLKVLFDAPSIEKLAQLIDEQHSSNPATQYDAILAKQQMSAPLSYSQQRLWTLDKMDAHGRFYAIPLIYDLHGEPDLHTLNQAINALIQRHQVLLTGYITSENGTDHQQVIPRDVEIQWVDAVDNPSDLSALETSVVDVPFDLAKGEVIRAGLAKIIEGHTRLYLAVHHIAADGWSLSILIDELNHFYQQFSKENHDSSLPNLPIQFSDYARWQRERYGKGTCITKSLEAYWQKKLDGAPEQHSLTLDFPRPAQPSHQGKSLVTRLDSQTTDKLADLARKHQTTLFNVLYTAFSVLLARFSGTQDVVIGTPVANRERPELEGLIGFFVNNLPLRTQVAEYSNFDDLLARNHRQILEDFEHQSLPFERMITLAKQKRALNTSPVFQVMLSIEQDNLEQVELLGLDAEALAPTETEARFDLTLGVRQSKHHLDFSWNFATDLFAETSVQAMADAFNRLLNQVAENPQRTIESYVLAKPRLIAEAPAAPSRTLLDLFELSLANNPEHTALVCGGETLSYASLDAKSNQLANRLVSHGVDVEEPVALVFERSIDMIVAMLAAVKAGGAYVPVDASQPATRIEQVIQDCGAKVVLSQQALIQSKLLELKDSELIEIAHNNLTGEPLAFERRVLPNQLAYVIYTSGSTGKPKGVMVEHQGVANYIQNQQRYLDLDSEEMHPNAGFLYLTNFAFDTSVASIWGALASGRPLHIVSELVRFDLDTLSEALYQPDHYAVAYIPPALLKELNTDADEALIPRIVVSGESTHPDLIQKLVTRTRLFNEYGPTENSVCSTVHEYQEGDDPGVIGRPIGGVQCVILDDVGSPVPDGVYGQLYLAGEGVARGYLRSPELTKEKFVSLDGLTERFYQTGDIVRLNHLGQLTFAGRADDQVKVRGHRIELGEIEHAICLVSGVASARVWADENGRLQAYVQPEKSVDNPSEWLASVREELVAQLPDYMIPATWACVESWPLTVNGKIDRNALPQAKAIQVENSQSKTKPPETKAEIVIAEVWQSLLNLEVVNANDNFFALGGDSISAMQSVSRCAAEGVYFSVRQLFEAQTVTKLANVATFDTPDEEQKASEGSVSLTPIQREFFQFACKGSQQNHFNQSVLLNVSSTIDHASILNIVKVMVERHDVLRLRFEATSLEGENPSKQQWQGIFQPLGNMDFQSVVLSESLIESNLFTERCNQIQTGLDIQNGPLFHFALFGEGTKHAKLFIVIHHLVVDGVSWRILLDDLQTLVEQHDNEQPLTLAAKPVTFKKWVEFNQQRTWRASEIAFWQQEERQIRPRFESVSGIDTQTVRLSLNSADTERLTSQANRAFGTQTQDLLLAALFQTLSTEEPNQGSSNHTIRRLSLALETHGRHTEGCDLNLSETLGWFTSIYPLNLVSDDPTLGDVICAIKEKVRRVPQHGLAYGWLKDHSSELDGNAQSPDILFNFLGHISGGESGAEDKSLSLVTGFETDDGTQNQMMPRALSFNGRIIDGVLLIDLDYNANVINQTEFARLTQSYIEHLQALIEHCCEQEKTRKTPSDFHCLQLSQSDVDQWLQALEKHSRNLLDVYPATGMQQGMIYHSELERDAYITQLTLSLNHVDGERLKAAWKKVLHRHDIFKTSFVLGSDGSHYQRVADQAVMRWQAVNLVGMSESDAHYKLSTIQKEERASGFELSDTTQTKFYWLQIEQDKGKLVWSTHHALTDGWCLPILMHELFECYASIDSAADSNLDDSIPYRRYVDWLQQQDSESARCFWQAKLGDIEEPTQLPTKSFNEKMDENLQGKGSVPIVLNADLTRQLESLAKEAQCTLNTVLQGAWAWLLSTYSGESRVVFGSTVSGRPATLAGSESMVGLFINTLPVVAEIERQAGVLDWLKGLQQGFAESEEHGYLPLHEIQSLSSVKGRNLFDSIVVFENYPIHHSEQQAVKNGFSVEKVEAEEETNFGLALQAFKTRDAEDSRLELSLQYDRAQFTDWQMTQMVEHLKNTLNDFVTHKTSALQHVQLLGASEVEELMSTLNGSMNPIPECSIHKLFEQYARETPDQIALIDGERQWSYRELDNVTNALARHLKASGINENDRVGVCVQRSAEMVVGVLAVLKVGGLYVPMDAKHPQARIELIAELASVQCLLTDGSADIAKSENALPSFRLSDWMSATSENEFESVHRNPQDSAMVIFTSGSTGQPKGVEIAHQGVVRLLKNTNFVSIPSYSSVGQVSSFSFDASSFDIWGALINGATTVILRDEDIHNVDAFADKIVRYNIKTFCMATALMNQLVELKPDLFATVDYLLFGGEAVNGSVVERMFEHGKPKHLVNVYGPAENATICATYDIQAIQPDYPMGRATNHSTVYVLNQHKQLLPKGVVGELYVGGKGIAKGYFDRDDLTQAKFASHSFEIGRTERLYQTGDRVRYNKDGQLEFVSRVDHQVKIRGQRLEPSEIQLRLLSLPKVEAAHVATVYGATEKQLFAAVQLTSNSNDEELERIKAQLIDTLPNYMVPSIWLNVEEMPLTPNGKVDTHALIAMAQNSNNRQVNTGAPRDDIEMKLYQIWRDILLEKEIGIRDHFFDVGGSSISAIKVMHFVEKQFGVRIPVVDLIKHTTIEALGGLVRGQLQTQKGERDSATPSSSWSHGVIEFRPSQNGKNVICIHPAGGTAFGYLPFAKAMPEEFGIYGIQAKGVDTDEDFLPTVQAMAEYYLSQVEPLLAKPHVFVGASYGGIVSFEMARLMKERGCNHSTAVVLDSEATEKPEVQAMIAPVSADVFREKLVKYNGMYPGIQDEQIARYHRLYNHHLATLKILRLEESNAQTLLVMATEDKDDEHLGLMEAFWSSKVSTPLKVETIKGDHSTLLEPPYINDVAEMIEKELSDD
ncbi:hypothetical protein TUMSATVNIG1_15020 [Vibrio nigripulchritudo]|uniref:non-ribosomal peptide synthetase n=1 Tax=Vibrio nigripulchritudo TaxID=28173 RepID=UPI00190CC7C7|nr:non-ribosomal peptide synthetase [Vibrio nigripulchritudo]BCL69551.1 hypothetical protein VNTUMSATTG_14880 [Vibrio nigripulchritudo]BDU30893.1 hypothetical protein TUMSATVNIG1_15020 [Vibrio nigripulchritudo]